MAVEPPPIAKSAYRQVGPNEVVVVGVELSTWKAITLATQCVVALTIGVVVSAPIWIIPLALLFALAGR